MIADIRLYTPEFELVSIIHKVKSSNWDIYYNKIGRFEAHLSISKSLVETILNYKYLVAVEGKYQAFVTAKQINEEIVIYGKTLNFLLSKRCVMPFDTSTEGIINNPVLVCNWLIDTVFIKDRSVITPDGSICILPGVKNMAIEDNSDLFKNSEEGYILTSPKAVSEIIIERLKQDEMGHLLFFDVKNKRWVFKVYKGEVRQLVLAEGNRNFYKMDYTADIQSKAVAGFFETKVESDNDEEKTNEKEYIFIKNDEYDDDTNPICIWDTVLNGSDETEARDSLNSFSETEEITGTIAHLEFGIDYELGDILRIQFMKNEAKKTFHRRVVGVQVYRENDEMSVEPILE